MGFLNPHSKHGYRSGDEDGDFWHGLESTYDRLKNAASVESLSSASSSESELIDVVKLACRYRILNRINHTGHSENATVGEQQYFYGWELNINMSRPQVFGEESSAGEELLQGCYIEAAEELRNEYKAIYAKVCRPRS